MGGEILSNYTVMKARRAMERVAKERTAIMIAVVG